MSKRFLARATTLMAAPVLALTGLLPLFLLLSLARPMRRLVGLACSLTLWL